MKYLLSDIKSSLSKTSVSNRLNICLNFNIKL